MSDRVGARMATWFWLLLAGVSACGRGEPAANAPSAGVLSIQRSVDNFLDLPACAADLAGTTASVASPPGLWACAGEWTPIACSKLLAGAVAYASDSGTLWACVSGAWSEIGRPVGDAGAPAAPPLVAVVAEPPGLHCAAGGQRIDVGADDDGSGVLDPGEVDSSAYVCNGDTAPSTIYAVKSGMVPTATSASLPHLLVTAVEAGRGFFVQVKDSEAGYTGADHSGLFVAAPAAVVTTGDRVDVRGTAGLALGEIELVASSVTVTSSGESPPAALVLTPAQAVMRAAALDGVLVAVQNVTATTVDGTTGAFTVGSGLRVAGDLFTLALPPVGQGFTAITGVLVERDAGPTLEPRSDTDVVYGDPNLAEFSPSQVTVALGALAVTTGPTPLTVRLSAPATVDTFVPVTSADPTAVTVENGGVIIAAGQDRAAVLVNGLTASGGVVLTASWGATILTAVVRVVGPTDSPRVASLTPATVTLAPGATQTFTVTLDFPPPNGDLVLIIVSPSGAGSAPPATVVPAGQFTSTFNFTAGSTPGAATITVRLRPSIRTAAVTIAP
jgi:hypothetical protein